MRVLNGVRIAVFWATGSRVFVTRKHTLLFSFLNHKAKKTCLHSLHFTYIFRPGFIPEKDFNQTLRRTEKVRKKARQSTAEVPK